MALPPRSRMLTQPAPPLLRLPRSAGNLRPVVFDTAMEQIERADAQSVKRGQPPTFPAITLLDADGQAWLLTVDTAGVLQTVAVDR